MSNMAAPGGQTIVDRLQAAIHTVDGSEMAKTVCKASTHELGAPKRKHLDKLQQLTREQNVNQPELLNLIVLRTKEKSWVVVLKALITAHHLMIHGNDRLLQCAASRPVLFTLEQFNDPTSPNGYDMSLYIRRYAQYLNKRAYAYRRMACDFCKLKKGKDSIWNKMGHAKLNKQIPELQSLLDALMAFKSKSSDLNNAVINSAFNLLHRDLIRLYATYNDAMIVVFKSFYEMKISECKLSLAIYKKFLEHLEEFKEFFELAERVGCVDRGDVPDLSKAPKQLLEPFEEHIKNGAPSSGENSANPSPSKSSKVGGPVNAGAGSGDPVQEALNEEAAALERFKSQKKQTPLAQNNNQPPTHNTTPQVQNPMAAAAQQRPPPAASYTEDLLNLGNEIGFGSNIVQQAQTQQIQQQQLQQQQQPAATFDPFGMTTTMQQQPVQQQQQQMNAFGMQPQQQQNPMMSNNPFNMPQASFNHQQPTMAGNPFGNPFSGNMMPQYNAPLPTMPMNNFQQTPPVQQQQQAKDPFADLLQPTQPANTGQSLFSTSTANGQPTNNNNKQVFGNNLDDTLSNMMNLNLVGNNNNKTAAATAGSAQSASNNSTALVGNPNNPFAF